ncbi:hypothetical protein E3U43_017341 [Larimichthys crocea]|uniref:Uncharacterized protein n=1 Tax=Larimichthys crocea TaxID=215358 RepID=A0ACD3R0Z0_LARCR|nr:hypothetical protein E3U43_017341 [Larimichthys crocea]
MTLPRPGTCKGAENTEAPSGVVGSSRYILSRTRSEAVTKQRGDTCHQLGLHTVKEHQNKQRRSRGNERLQCFGNTGVLTTHAIPCQLVGVTGDSYGFGYSSKSVLSPFVFEDSVHCSKEKGT